jgi:hypothetical protein
MQSMDKAQTVKEKTRQAIKLIADKAKDDLKELEDQLKEEISKANA